MFLDEKHQNLHFEHLGLQLVLSANDTNHSSEFNVKLILFLFILYFYKEVIE